MTNQITTTMKAYGIRIGDFGCCPGHDKFSDQKYNNNRSHKAHSRDTKLAHRRARKSLKNDLRKEVEEELLAMGQHNRGWAANMQ